MKNLFLFLLVIVLNGCCNNPDTIIYSFTEVENEYVPYEKQNIVKWQDNNGTVFNGTVLDKSTRINEVSEYDCKKFQGQEINAHISINNENYSISFEKRGPNNIDLNISQSVNGIPKRGFGVDVSHFGFTTIEFNNETFNDAIKLAADGDVYLGTLIYSKTNGIEFILFEDGTWYKRVE